MSSVGFVGLLKDVGALRSFTNEVNGERKQDYLESRRRLGIEKERVFLSETPMGAMVSAYSEGLNVGFLMARVRASANAFDKHWLAALTKMSGIDHASIPPGPPPHLIFEWTSGRTAKGSTMIGAPVPEPAKLWQFCRDMTARYGEHAESRERVGITLERVFYLHEAKKVAVYLEGDDPAGAIEQSFTSSSAYDKWFAESASAVHGIDFRASKPPRPELLVSYDR